MHTLSAKQRKQDPDFFLVACVDSNKLQNKQCYVICVGIWKEKSMIKLCVNLQCHKQELCCLHYSKLSFSDVTQNIWQIAVHTIITKIIILYWSLLWWLLKSLSALLQCYQKKLFFAFWVLALCGCFVAFFHHGITSKYGKCPKILNTLFHTIWLKFCFLCRCLKKYLVEWVTL